MYFLIKMKKRNQSPDNQISFYVMNFRTDMPVKDACKAISIWFEKKKNKHQSIPVFHRAYRTMPLEHIELLNVRAVIQENDEKNHAFQVSKGKKLALKERDYREIESYYND